MGNYALLNALCAVKPQVKDYTNNEACKPGVAGKAEKKDGNNKGKPGKSAHLNPLPISVNKKPYKEAAEKKLLNKRDKKNRAEKLRKKEEVGGRGKLHGIKPHRN